MIQFCEECYQEVINAPSWVTPLAQSVTALAAVWALRFAWKNLRGLNRAQSFQAQMNLISLENEVRKNLIHYKIVCEDYAKADLQHIDLLVIKKLNAFELYVSSADKLAALINAKFLSEQFPDRDWKLEYKDIFKSVVTYHEGEKTIIPGKAQMIRNINALLLYWG